MILATLEQLAKEGHSMAGWSDARADHLQLQAQLAGDGRVFLVGRVDLLP